MDAEQIHLRMGGDPWKPADTADRARVLNYYHKPIQGILKQHRRRYLFWCIDGQAAHWSLWVYVPLRRGEHRKLARLEGDALIQFATSLLIGRWLTVAVASETEGLHERVLVQIQVETTKTIAQPVEEVAKKGWREIHDRNEEIRQTGNLAPI